MGELLVKHDATIPLAALVGSPLSASDEAGTFELNQDAVVALMRRPSPDQRVVFPKSNRGYGPGASNAYFIKESSLRPVSLYDRTKVKTESAGLDAGHGVSLRLVFGISPHIRLDRLVNALTWRAMYERAVILFEAHFRRKYIHVRDLVKAFNCVRNFVAMAGRLFNVRLTDANPTKRQLCECIAQHVLDFPYLESPIGERLERRDCIMSDEKLENTGWRADHSIDSRIVELAKGFRMLRNRRFSNV